MKLLLDTLTTPLGDMTAAFEGDILRLLEFSDGEERIERHLKRWHGGFETARATAPQGLQDRLNAYFRGDKDPFRGLEADPVGTPFQRAVWRLLRTIPRGRTLSYGELAEKLGRPGAARAVGAANGRNPIAIIIPCHRVIGGDGTLTGYAGGLERKRKLLELEAAP